MSNLNQLLQKELDAFQSHIQSNFEEYSDKPVTSGELAEFGKQVFYVLDAFREYIVDELNKD